MWGFIPCEIFNNLVVKVRVAPVCIFCISIKMAEKQLNIGKGGRFGARYSRRLRDKVAIIAAEKRASTKCPYCNYDAVKRLAAGIWFCKKCSSKFAGKAYTQKSEIKFEKKEEKEEPRKRVRAAKSAADNGEAAEVSEGLQNAFAQSNEAVAAEDIPTNNQEGVNQHGNL